MTKQSNTAALRNPNLWILPGAGLIGILLSWLLIYNAEQQHYAELEQVGNERLNLYASTVEAAHRRFDYLPFIVAEDRQVQRLLHQSDNNQALTEAVNRKLQRWQDEANAADLYLMDKAGLVVAASNWQQEDSFIGKDYHFRPYFQSSIEGLPGRFFAIGVTTTRPGLFLSRPVLFKDEIIGVAVIKIDMTQLEADWAAGGENVWVADTDGIIFLSSNPQWRYRSLNQLSLTTRSRLAEEQKYSNHPIQPLHMESPVPVSDGVVVINLNTEADAPAAKKSYLLHQREIKGLNWQLYYLSDLQGLIRSKQLAVLFATLSASLLAFIGFFLSSRWRHQQQLELRVEQRTQALNATNSHLKKEIAERIRTEQALRQTHEELIQAEKLAALGQLSAGLVHEISQPLSAIQTFLASTRLLMDRGEMQLVGENLADIDKLTRRVTGIVSHLKTFSSKSRGVLSRVELQQVIENALLVLNPRISKTEIALDWQSPQTPISVHADEIKLEQILINLIRNAIDAVEAVYADTDDFKGEIAIAIKTEHEQAVISIIDNGCGIDAANLPKLFDPFFTTKPPGEGLGLGLSVSFGIVEQFGGTLEALSNPAPARGTTFQLTLSLAQTELNHVG